MTNSLQQMSQRREAWLNEKPQGFGNNLRGLKAGDEIFFHFVASGDDGDRFIKIYRAHTWNITDANGRRSSPVRYCLHQNDGEPCQYCEQGQTSVKERMGIWMYVHKILRLQMPPGTPPDKFPPQIVHEGRYYFNEEVNDFRFWENSAWRESPWGDIVKLAELYKGLHNFGAQMTVVGDAISRRYKLYAIPNSPAFPPEIYERAKQELKSVVEVLKEQLASPVMVNPTATGNQPINQPATVSQVVPFQAFTNSNTAVNATPISFNPFGSAAAPPAAAPVEEPAEEPIPEQPQDEKPPWENKEDDNKKPLSSMF